MCRKWFRKISLCISTVLILAMFLCPSTAFAESTVLEGDVYGAADPYIGTPGTPEYEWTWMSWMPEANPKYTFEFFTKYHAYWDAVAEGIIEPGEDYVYNPSLILSLAGADYKEGMDADVDASTPEGMAWLSNYTFYQQAVEMGIIEDGEDLAVATEELAAPLPAGDDSTDGAMTFEHQAELRPGTLALVIIIIIVIIAACVFWLMTGYKKRMKNPEKYKDEFKMDPLPGGFPGAGGPPMGAPPAGAPPMGAPTFEAPPVGAPPTGMPSAENPSPETPHAGMTPGEEPITETMKEKSK